MDGGVSIPPSMSEEWKVKMLLLMTAGQPTHPPSNKSTARGSRDVVPHDEWIIRGQSALGPISWVWGSNDHRNGRSYHKYRCSNGQLQLAAATWPRPLAPESWNGSRAPCIHLHLDRSLAQYSGRRSQQYRVTADLTRDRVSLSWFPLLHAGGPGPGLRTWVDMGRTFLTPLTTGSRRGHLETPHHV